MEVLYREQGATAYLTIHRQAALNALNTNVLRRLESSLEALEASKSIVSVIVTGAGDKAFVAGADVREVQAAGAQRPELIDAGKRVLAKIRLSDKIFIAAINGYALGGGCELALFCDLRIASENARFGFPEAKLGLIPGYGGTQLLPRLIGPGKAKYLMLSGDIIGAAEAYRLGLVDKVYPLDALLAEADGLAANLASKGPLALGAIKRAIDRGMELALPQALSVEAAEYRRVALSNDAERGMSAFLEKRTPTFQGD